MWHRPCTDCNWFHRQRRVRHCCGCSTNALQKSRIRVHKLTGGSPAMRRLAASCCVGLLVLACNGSPVAPSPWAPRPLIVGDAIHARVTSDDRICDPCCPTRCLSYSVTAPRAGLLEVTLTWIPRDSDAEPLGFSVTEPTGRRWYPTEPGVTRRVQLSAGREDSFRINVWAAPGEEFQMQTLLR